MDDGVVRGMGASAGFRGVVVIRWLRSVSAHDCVSVCVCVCVCARARLRLRLRVRVRARACVCVTPKSFTTCTNCEVQLLSPTSKRPNHKF